MRQLAAGLCVLLAACGARPPGSAAPQATQTVGPETGGSQPAVAVPPGSRGFVIQGEVAARNRCGPGRDLRGGFRLSADVYAGREQIGRFSVVGRMATTNKSWAGGRYRLEDESWDGASPTELRRIVLSPAQDDRLDFCERPGRNAACPGDCRLQKPQPRSVALHAADAEEPSRPQFEAAPYRVACACPPTTTELGAPPTPR